MKRTVFMILVIGCIIACLPGCGGDKKPENMSDTAYRAGQKAVEITEQYLNMDITAEEAHDQLEDVYNRLDAQKTDELGDLAVSIDIVGIQIKLLPYPDDAEVAQCLEELKNMLKG